MDLIESQEENAALVDTDVAYQDLKLQRRPDPTNDPSFRGADRIRLLIEDAWRNPEEPFKLRYFLSFIYAVNVRLLVLTQFEDGWKENRVFREEFFGSVPGEDGGYIGLVLEAAARLDSLIQPLHVVTCDDQYYSPPLPGGGLKPPPHRPPFTTDTRTCTYSRGGAIVASYSASATTWASWTTRSSTGNVTLANSQAQQARATGIQQDRQMVGVVALLAIADAWRKAFRISPWELVDLHRYD